MKHPLLILTLLTICQWAPAQDSSNKSSFSYSGYAEIYYQYDFNKPADGSRPGFIYSHSRHNEVNLNLAFAKATYTTKKVRASLALATGTYINANYAAEPGVLKNVFEASAGLKLSRKKNWWLDAGIFPSHIGFESAVSKDCWTLTRSMAAENSPYFEAGVKLTYITGNGKWTFAGMALNGWQRITRLSGNSLISWGTQLQFKPSDKFLLNYSTFIGTDKPDSARQLRIFHNLYGIVNISNKAGLILSFDIGTDEKPSGGAGTNAWYSPGLVFKYSVSNRWSLSARAEYYHDKSGIIISSNTPSGFQTTGFSLNADFTPVKNVVVRLEGKRLNSKDKVFTRGNAITNGNTSLNTSIAIAF